MNAAMQMTDTSGPATMIQLSGLERFANYTITVLGFTVSLGEESDPVTVRTNEDGKCNGVTQYIHLLHVLMHNVTYIAMYSH